MGKLLWLIAALSSCANAGAPPEPARRTLPTRELSQPLPVAAAPATTQPGAELAAPSPIVIVAGGDVSFGREVGQRLQHEPDYSPLSFIQRTWQDADVRFVNLESQLSFQNGETQSPYHRLIFTGPPEGARALSAAAVTLVSTANNHAWDYGRGALLETLEHLKQAQVLYTGTGRDLEEATRPVRLQIRGVRIAWFAVTHVWNQGP
jgi:poly-gamma-glutamate capsule biosynthesis protein CapA/YwtB (metallophosphatase superfamily)